MHRIARNAIAIAVVQSGCDKGVSGAYEMQRGNVVEPDKADAYRPENRGTL
jgi:hypothetical protein